MEQPEIPPEPAPLPASPPDSEPAPKAQLPDPKGVLPIPDHFRLPFHGKMATPTSVPSATQRRYNLNLLKKRSRRRGFLAGLLAGQILIIAMDLGGELLLRLYPQVKLQAPIRVASIVFLGMTAGAAIMILAVALIQAFLGLRALFGKQPARVGRGITGILATVLTLGVTMGVILGTAWFMIPQPEWKPTVDFARAQGVKVRDAAKERVRSMFTSAPRTP